MQLAGSSCVLVPLATNVDLWNPIHALPFRNKGKLIHSIRSFDSLSCTNECLTIDSRICLSEYILHEI